MLGLLMLDGPFLTIPGSLAHASTFSAGVLYRVVPGATGWVVASPSFAEVTDAYAQTARRLANEGATVLAANCGFAVVYEPAIRSAADLPLVSSTLPLLGWLHAVHGDRVGVMTWDAAQLDMARRRAAGWDDAWDVPVADLQGSQAWQELAGTIPSATTIAAMRADLVTAARDFAQRARLTALLLECTGFAPFARELSAATTLPAYDIVSLVDVVLDRTASDPEGAHE